MDYLGKPDPNFRGRDVVVMQGTEPPVHRPPPSVSIPARHPLGQQVGESLAAYQARIKNTPQSDLKKAMMQ